MAWLKNLSLLLLLIFSFEAYACRCVEPSEEKAESMASIIVIGYVESVIKAPIEGSTAIIRVEKSIKGKASNRIAVRTVECEFLWEEGKRYKLHLLQDDMGFYHTRRCLGNKEY